MPLTEDFARLQKEGASASDILTKFKQFSPQDAGDIDKLMKEGHNPSDVLTKLGQFHDQAAAAPQAPTDDSPMSSMENWRKSSWGDVAEHFGKELQYGAANAAVGLGATAKRASNETIANAGQTLQDFGQGIAPTGYTPDSSKIKWNHPSTWGNVPGAIAEGVPGLLASAGAGVVGGPVGFVASEAAQHYGPNAEAYEAATGKPLDLMSKSGGVVAGATAAEALLNRFGLGRAGGAAVEGAGAGLKSLPGTLIGAPVKHAFEGSAMGAGNALINEAGRLQDTPNAKLDLDKIGNAALIGGTATGAIRAARTPGDVMNAKRFASFGSDDATSNAATSVANRQASADTAPTNTAKSYKNITEVNSAIRTDIGSAMKQNGEYFNANPAAKEAVDRVYSKLQDGAKLSKEDTATLDTHLDSEQPFQGQLKHNLHELSVLNRVKKVGNYNENDHTFGGGLSSTAVGKFLDPLSIIKSPGSHAAAGGVGLAVLGHEIGLEALLPFIAKVGLGATAGMRSLDYMLQSRNTGKNFMDRFAGKTPEGGFGPNTPSPAIPPTAPKDVPPEVQGQPTLNNFGLGQIAKNRMLADNARTAATEAEKTRVQTEKDNAKATKQAARDSARQEAQQFSNDYLNARAQNQGVIAREKEAEATAKATAKAVAQAEAEKFKNDHLNATFRNDQINMKAATARREADADNRAFHSAETSAANNANKAFDKAGKDEERAAIADQKSEERASRQSEALRKRAEQATTKAKLTKERQDFNNDFANATMRNEAMNRKEREASIVDAGATKARLLEAVAARAKIKEAEADNRAFNSQETSAANAANKAFDKAKAAAAAKATLKDKPEAKAKEETPAAAKPTPKKDIPRTDDIIVTHDGITVRRPKAGVENEEGYRNSIHRNLQARSAFARNLKEALPADDAQHVDKLVHDLSGNGMTKAHAKDVISDFLDTHVSQKRIDTVLSIVNGHYGRLMGTYKHD